MGNTGPCCRRAIRSAQEKFYEDAVAAVRSAQHTAYRFRPLTRAKSNGVATVN